MKKFFLFLISCQHVLVFSSRSSASISYENFTLLLKFKALLADAWAYNYSGASQNIANKKFNENMDVILRTAENLSKQGVIRDAYKNYWQQIIAALASSNNYFHDVLPKHVSVKAMSFLAYILKSFGIPHNLINVDDSRAERVSWTCLRKLYQQYLDEMLPEAPTNMYGIVVFLYIHVFGGIDNLPLQPSTSNTSEAVQKPYTSDTTVSYQYNLLGSNSSTRRPVRFYNVVFTPNSPSPTESVQQSVPHEDKINVGNSNKHTQNMMHVNAFSAFTGNGLKQKMNHAKSVESIEELSLSNAESEKCDTSVPENDCMEIHVFVQPADVSSDEENSILNMLVTANESRLVFEDQDDRYAAIDIVGDQ